MSKNFEHLVMLYEQMYKMGIQIKEMIESDNIEEVENIAKNKSNLIEKILRFEKTTKLSDEEKIQQKELRSKIELLEKENIELLERNREILKKELQSVSKGKKVTGAYLSELPQTHSTIDITE